MGDTFLITMNPTVTWLYFFSAKQILKLVNPAIINKSMDLSLVTPELHWYDSKDHVWGFGYDLAIQRY